MKKTLVALAVAAVAATSANAVVVYNQDGSKVELGGSVRVLLLKQTNLRTDLINDGSFIDVKGNHEIGEGLLALGYAKIKFSNEAFATAVQLNKLYAGFKHNDIGQLTFGRQVTIADDVSFSDFSVKLGGIDQYLLTSGNRTVHFKSASFAGFSFGADYVFGNVNRKDGNGNAVGKSDGYALGALYSQDYDGVKVDAGLAYTRKNDTSLNSSGDEVYVKDSSLKGFKTGLSVGFNGVTLGLDYLQTKLTSAGNARKTFQFGAGYQVTKEAKVAAIYSQTKQGNYKSKSFGSEFEYKLHPSVQTFVGYHTQKVRNVNRDNKVYAGLRVHF